MALNTGDETAATRPSHQSSVKAPGHTDWRQPSLLWLTTFLVIVFPFATLFINRGDSYTLGLLTLAGVWVWAVSSARRWLNRDSVWLWIVCALFFGVLLLSYVLGVQTDAGFRFLGRYLRFLLVVPVYLAFRRYPPPAKAVFIGLAGGALVGGVLALLRFLHAQGAVRIAASTDLSIIFGDLTATMVLCTVAGFGVLAAMRRRWAVPLLVLCLAGGMAATLLSGTRGAWLAFLFLLLLLSTRFGGFLKARYAVLIFAVIVAAFLVSYLVPRTATHSRLGTVGVQVHDYFASLGTFAPLADPSKGHPRCLDAHSFLEAWVSAGRRVGSVPADISVAADDDLAESQGRQFGCTAGYAVRIYNPDHDGAAQYLLPRVAAEAKGPQQTELLARGAGVLSFVGGGDNHANIKGNAYQVMNLSGGSARGDNLNAFVGAGQTLWMVPLESYIGEYSFAPANNNVGTRLEMWRAAWHLFLKHPVLGVGVGAYQVQTRDLINKHEIAPVVGSYDHPHSDYFNMLSSAGIVGLLAFLAVLIVPFLRFLRALPGKQPEAHALGLAGALTVIGFAIYALTDTVFLHSMMITWYVIYMALFYALLDAHGAAASKPKRLEQ